MPALRVPDALFDADAATRPISSTSIPERFDWIIEGGILRYDPVVAWTWSCPACGASGTIGDWLDEPGHAAEHARSPFDVIVPLEIDVRRVTDEG